MKKFVLILLTLVFLALLGGIVFLFTLNVDQYRPQIEGQLASALGKSVRLEKISIGWHGGAALSLQGLLIAHDQEFQREFLRLESGKAELHLMPLLNREIQISSLYLENPVIRLVKKRNGEFEGFEQKAAAAKPANASPSSSQKTAAALSLLVSAVHLEDGEVFYRDESGPQPTEITVRDVDVRLKNLALNQPIDIEAKAALFSRHQNTELTGTLKVSPDTGHHLLRNLHAETNLEALEMQELARLIPSVITPSGALEMAGNLTFDIDSLKLDAKGLKDFSAKLQFKNGKLKMPDVKAPVENIGVSILAASDTIKLQSFVADFAGGKIQGKGTVNLKTPKPLTTMDLQIKNLLLENILEPPLDSQAPQLKGILFMDFKGTMAGDSGPALTETLAGDGSLVIERGVILNLNILREIFRKLSMIPGLVDNLQRRLPEDYQEKLNARDTVLDGIQIPFTAKEGTLILNKMDVKTDTFAMAGGGSYRISSSALNAQANLFIEPQLSEALIKSVRELQSLTDRSGALMIPLNIQGKLPNISVIPDLQYIASRLAAATTQDVLNSLFKKPEPQGGAAAASGASTQTAQGSSTQEPAPTKTKFPKGSAILGQLLESALAPESSSDSKDSSNSTRSGGSYF